MLNYSFKRYSPWKKWELANMSPLSKNILSVVLTKIEAQEHTKLTNSCTNTPLHLHTARLITHHYIMQLNLNIGTLVGLISKHSVTQNWFPLYTTPHWHQNNPVDFAINVAERIPTVPQQTCNRHTPYQTRSAIIIKWVSEVMNYGWLWSYRSPLREHLVSSLYLWTLYEY